MRFEDWDVLIFPGDGPDAHIPLQEFSVECYAITDDRLLKNETITAPLMTGFVPSLAPGQPFTISLHSWRPKPFSFRPADGTPANAPQVWQFKVVIDGEVRCADTMTADVKWPKVIHEATADRGQPGQLLFPPFHEDRIRDKEWHPYGDQGRIKVEIAEGFLQKRNGTTEFVKLTVHAIFNFLHAPMKVLEDCGKAWPCSYVLEKKRLMAPHMAHGAADEGEVFLHQEPEQFRHHAGGSRRQDQQRPASGPHPYPPTPMYNTIPGMPPPTPSYAFDHHPGPSYYYDGRSSRSTSAYSTVSWSAMPLQAHFGPPLPAPRYPSGDSVPAIAPPPPFDPNIEVHIPSDQLQKVVELLERRANGSAMAPPPLPAHVIDAKSKCENARAVQSDAEGNMEHAAYSTHRRAASRSNFSDVSMHAGCPDFPECTTEDHDGQVVHHPGQRVAPAAVMRGRKEGDNDQRTRDFMSTILHDDSDDSFEAEGSEAAHPRVAEPPSVAAKESGKKRTRASVKSRSVNEDGSPEKEDKVAGKPARKLRKHGVAAAENA